MKDSTWRIWSDGAARPNPGEMGLGVAILAPDRSWHKIARRAGQGTNNIAEWTATIVALTEALRLGARRVELYLDSELVVRQLNGDYAVKADHLRPLYERAQELMKEFDDVWIKWTPRWNNTMADALANQALTVEEALA